MVFSLCIALEPEKLHVTFYYIRGKIGMKGMKTKKDLLLKIDPFISNKGMCARDENETNTSALKC